MAKSGFDGKEVLRVSGISTLRYRAPTNPKVADNMMQFTVDYGRQKSFIPDNRKNAIVEQTQGTQDMTCRPINKSGMSAALGPLKNADIGSVDDESGRF